MAEVNIQSILRDNIRNLKPYSSARDEFQGEGVVLLDANESPFNHPLNRYPDPHQRALKSALSIPLGIPADSIFLGNGSDEAIDLLIRAFCEPSVNNIVSISPSYGMYEVCANINNVEFRKVLLNDDFSLNVNALLKATDANSRLIFLCSPNNPTANLLAAEEILYLVNAFKGLVIVDEAYIDFSGTPGLLSGITKHNNLVILRTFSKSRALAGIRLGMALANPEIISILDRIKYPYNLNQLSLNAAQDQLVQPDVHQDWIHTILKEREVLRSRLTSIPEVIKVFPSDANFLLVKVKNPLELYNYLKMNGVIVRDRSNSPLCGGCLRISVGSPEENLLLIRTIKSFK